MQRRTRKLIALAGVAIVIFVVGKIALNRIPRMMRIHWTTADSPDQRAKGFNKIAKHRQRNGKEAIIRALKQEQDHRVLVAAGHAASCLQLEDAVGLLRQRAEQVGDTWARAKLMGNAVRASSYDPALSEWYEAGLASEEPWRRAGSAAALLELGDPKGAEYLLGVVEDGPADMRSFAYQRLRTIAAPVTVTLGYVMPWPTDVQAFVESAPIDAFEAWWHDNVDSASIVAVRTQLQTYDRRWRRINRLINGSNQIESWMD